MLEFPHKNNVPEPRQQDTKKKRYYIVLSASRKINYSQYVVTALLH